MAYTRTAVAAINAVGTSGGAAADTESVGITNIGGGAGSYVLKPPPYPGAIKTLVWPSSTTAASVVKLCTNAAQSISLVGVSTNLTVISKTAGASTVAATVVQLMGYNSTSWVLLNAWPVSTTPTVNNYGGTVTLTST